MCTLSQPDRFW